VGLNALLYEDKINFYVHDLYVGPRSIWTSSIPTYYYGGSWHGAKLAGYNTVDINVMTTDKLIKNLSLSLAINNIFDVKAWDPPLRNATTSGLAPLPRRIITVQVTKKW
jgi:outer membrane receptor protein involved in Fe transport